MPKFERVRVRRQRGFNPERAKLKGLTRVVRNPKIKNLPRGEFTVFGKPSRVFHVTTSYPKVIANQQQMEAWDKTAPKGKRKDKRKNGPVAKIIIRTHNKEYAQKIKVQDKLRKENAYMTIKLRWKIFKYFKGKKALTKNQIDELKEMITALVEQTDKMRIGEDFFLKKSPANPSRKLAENRIKFIRQNLDEIGGYLYYLPITREDYWELQKELFRFNTQKIK